MKNSTKCSSSRCASCAGCGDEAIHIAIDGPVASGKGTVARLLAKRLNIPALDTGAMYRAVAVWMIEGGVDLSSESEVEFACTEIDMEVNIISGETIVFINGGNYTHKIRENRVSQLASDISLFPCVRNYLTKLQQKIAETQSFILEGRDISSVVLPNAKYKFYLTASVEARAKRRHAELVAKGQKITLDEVISQVEARDKQDKERNVAPLVKVKDAIIIDNTTLDIEQTLQAFCDIISA